jgi:hypothetical protein
MHQAGAPSIGRGSGLCLTSKEVLIVDSVLKLTEEHLWCILYRFSDVLSDSAGHFNYGHVCESDVMRLE